MQNTTATTKPQPPAGAILTIGEPVTFTVHTDSKAGYVERISRNHRTALVRLAKQTLLNGANSGEPDAIKVTPGGFAGHTEGKQRWAVEPDPTGHLVKFTLRQSGPFWQWKVAGAATRSPGNTLRKGHSPYYDFNF